MSTERIKERRRAWYEANKDRISALNKAKRAAERELKYSKQFEPIAASGSVMNTADGWQVTKTGEPIPLRLAKWALKHGRIQPANDGLFDGCSQTFIAR